MSNTTTIRFCWCVECKTPNLPFDPRTRTFTCPKCGHETDPVHPDIRVDLVKAEPGAFNERRN